MKSKIRNVMTEQVVSLDGESTVADAARAMRDEGIGDVIVRKGLALEGIVTDRDLVVRCVAEGLNPATTRLASLCSADLLTVGPDDDPSDAVRLMQENAVRRLPVVDGDQTVGIVSLGDLALHRDRTSALGNISAAPPNR